MSMTLLLNLWPYCIPACNGWIILSGLLIITGTFEFGFCSQGLVLLNTFL